MSDDDVAEEVDVAKAQRAMLKKLKIDLRTAARALKVDEARYLVDLYYQVQDFRLQAGNQKRAAESEADPDQAPEPNALIAWAFDEFKSIEKLIADAMDVYTETQEIGRWAKSITGIGPILAAGLIAHIDLSKSATVGNLWSFAGQNPLAIWKKGEKRPWNAKLKCLVWKIGESFTKVSNHEDDIYGKLYKQRKVIEVAKNAAGDFKDQAAFSLANKKYGKDTDAFKHYTDGHLPPARIQLRSQRWARKMFLSHWFVCAKFSRFGILPPRPYAIDVLKHAHVIPIPNLEFVPGLAEALVKEGRTA